MTSEEQLLISAQAGDIDAFEALQARLEPDITRFVRRLTNSPDVTEDIVQDTFIALYTHLKSIDPPEKLRPYVYRIARNRSYDEFRRWEREDLLSLDDEPTHLWVSYTTSDPTKRPDELTHWMLLLLEVQDAMDDLPDLQRQALILYSEYQMSYAEIAEVMNCSLGTVKSRLYHAKQSLRRMVRPETLQAIETLS